MDTGSIDTLSRHRVAVHRLTHDDYHRMGEAGILGDDDRVELPEGQLVDMPPIGPRHALAVDALMELLVFAMAGKAGVRVQNPVALNGHSESQPDIVLTRRPWRGHPHDHPGTEDVLLVIEVADSSLEKDRGAKLELYARSGVREFWIVDLAGERVDVHRAPVGEGCASVATVGRTGVLDVEAMPGVTVPVAVIFT